MIWAATELAVSLVTQKACAAQKILGVHVARPAPADRSKPKREKWA
jgi:hypothetical protein